MAHLETKRGPLSGASPRVTTDHKWKAFRYRSEVPARVLKRQFDWTQADHEKHGDYLDGFVKYKGTWYHVADFESVPRDAVSLQGWDGYHAHGFSSGVVIKLSSDGESYKIGTYIA